MVSFIRYPIVALVLTLLAGPAAAADLTLEIRDGRVTLIARDVSTLQILNEWAKVGNTRILEAERIVGPPVTLEFAGLFEREALDLILRSAAGYVAVPRQSGHPGASVFDRILVLAASNPPPASRGAASIPVPPATQAFDPRPSKTLLLPPEFEGEERHEAPMPGQEPRAVPHPDAVRPFSRAAGAAPTGSSVPGFVIPPADKPDQP